MQEKKILLCGKVRFKIKKEGVILKENMNKSGLVKRILAFMLTLAMITGLVGVIPVKAATTTIDLSNMTFSVNSNSASNILYLDGTNAPSELSSVTRNTFYTKSGDATSGIWLDDTQLTAGSSNRIQPQTTSFFQVGGFKDASNSAIQASSGQILTIKGSFYATIDSQEYELVVPEMKFQYNGTTWTVYEEEVELPIMTITSLRGGEGTNVTTRTYVGYTMSGEFTLPSDVNNTYFKPEDKNSGVWLQHGEDNTWIDMAWGIRTVSTSSADILWGTGTSYSASDGDILTIKGTFSNTTYGSFIIEEVKLQYTASTSTWVIYEEEPELPRMTIVSLRGGEGTNVTTRTYVGYTMSDEFTLPSDVNNTYFKPIDTESGVWLNDTRIEMSYGIRTISASSADILWGTGTSYSAVSGDVLTVKGTFSDGNGSSFIVEDIQLKYNGSSWEVYVPTTVIDMSEETITISSLNETNNTTPEKLLYLAATDYSTLGTDVYYAKDENSGIYINGVEVTTRLKRGGTGFYQVGSGAEPLDAIAGDVLTIKGTFVGQESGTEWIMPSLQFKFTGTTWVNNIIDMRNDVVTVYESSVNSANLFNFQSTDYSELETGVLYSAKASDTESGVFLGETAVTTQIKRAATGVYQVGNGGAPINASAGAIVTVKGEFFNPDKTIALILPEMKFQYVSDSEWILYTEKAGDYTGDGATDVRDLVRIKRYLNNNNVQLAKAAQIDSGTIIDDNDVNDLYYILLCGYEKDENGTLLGTPYYVDDVAVERMAYECPEVGTYDSSNDTFTAYSTTEVDAAFQKYKLAGLTLLSSRTVAPLSDDSTKTGATARLDAYMEAAERNGLRVLVDSVYINTLRYDYNSLSGDEFSTKYGVNNTSSTLFDHDYQQKVYNQVSKIVKYGNTCAGFIVGDEWQASEAELYNNIIAAIRKAETDLGLDLIITTSQYPSSAYDVDVTLLQEGATSSDDEETLYRNYINKFGTNGMFTFDIYPLIYSEKLFSGSAYSVNEDFFNSLKWMAEEARDNDIAHTGITIQSCGLSGTDSLWSKYERYTPENIEDIGFQIYTSLAYGVKEINYFTYNDHPVDTNVHDSINENASVYTAVQTINNELDAFDHVYMNYTWKNALDITAGTTISETENSRLSKAEVTGGRTIIGCMEDRLGYDGYMIANAEGPRTDNHAQVTLTFANADQVIVYANGKKTTQTLDANGALTLEVNVGEGAFVIPIKSALTLLDFVVEVEEGKDPVVLQITDTQIIDAAQQRVIGRLSSDEAAYWANDQMEERCYDYLAELINSQTEEPDLILVTGDLVYGEFDDKGTAFEKFVTVMDSFQIPWAPIFGNHEAETKVTDGTLSGIDVYCKLLEASAESDTGYCLFKQRALTGNGNYTVGIQQGTELKRVFFMLDSNGSYHASDESIANGHTETSVGFGKDQIEWYTDAATQITAVSPATKLSFAFHIQLAAFTDAYAKYGFTNSNTVNHPINIDNAENKANDDFGYLGRDLKDPWDSRYQVYEGLKNLGVDSIFVGHEHCNSASVVYEGIRFQFGQKSSTYDRANYLTAEGEIVGASKDVGTPLVGGTFIPLDADSGVIKNPYIYLCKEE